MLNPSSLVQILSASLSVGVDSAFIITREGTLLSRSDGNDNIVPTAAIASTIWNDYEEHLVEEEQGSLSRIVIEGEHGKLVVAHINSFYLCVMGNGPTGRLVDTIEKLTKTVKSSLESLNIDPEY